MGRELRGNREGIAREFGGIGREFPRGGVLKCVYFPRGVLLKCAYFPRGGVLKCIYFPRGELTKCVQFPRGGLLKCTDFPRGGLQIFAREFGGNGEGIERESEGLGRKNR